MIGARLHRFGQAGHRLQLLGKRRFRMLGHDEGLRDAALQVATRIHTAPLISDPRAAQRFACEWPLPSLLMRSVPCKLPLTHPAAEAELRGQVANDAAFTHAADRLLRDARGYKHNSFKIDLARRGIVRALAQAAQGTRNRNPAKRSSKQTDGHWHESPGGLEDVMQPAQPLSKSVTPAIGTPTSRVNGRAKVTGAAKYAAEFGTPGLAYGSVVTSTIARGRIVRIEASEALRVQGVIDVLTHQNRPPLAGTDSAYKDETAPAGSPFRPLYDDRIRFSGQPVALVVAETPQIARFAASLVRVEYNKEAHVTDLYSQHDKAFALEVPAVSAEAEDALAPPKPRGTPEAALAAAKVRHQGEYFVPIEHHNPMELFASTAIWEGDGKLTVYDKTQGVQNVQRYLCGVFDLKPDKVRVMSPFMGGGFGSGLRPQFQVVLAVLAARALRRSVRVVLTRHVWSGRA